MANKHKEMFCLMRHQKNATKTARRVQPHAAARNVTSQDGDQHESPPKTDYMFPITKLYHPEYLPEGLKVSTSWRYWPVNDYCSIIHNSNVRETT